MLAVPTHLLDKDLARLFVDVIQRLLLIIRMSFRKSDLSFDSVCGPPAQRHSIWRLYHGILGHIGPALMSPVRLIQLRYKVVLSC